MNTVIQYDNSMIDYSLEVNSTPDQDYNYWWLELNDKGAPIREMAFDKAGEVCYAAPNQNDLGIWCDSPIYFDLSESHEFISNDKFEKEWNSFRTK